MSARYCPAVRLALCALLLLTQAGCSWMHRGHQVSCSEPAIGGDVRNLPPLQIPPGLDAPDTRNAIKIPPLTEPERPRLKTDPCLSRPPSFKA